LEARELNFERFRAIYGSNLDRKDKRYFLAFAQDAVLGFISVSVDGMLFCADKLATIDELIVTETARGKGVGRALLDAVRACAKDEGCVAIGVTSNLRRMGAHAFYERYGFVKNGYRFGLAI
jgi:GNAT superfamily N-acetyltransferase